ncbi:zinc finger protein [Wuchereria bancrofti]|uniref:Zinc finger protein n=1 Tax=Wuchereria bancrofti TaxID=6293 RepID=J9EUW6_WUCBA|nr:zinc finger protein [Wuchereria bancrofti]
MIRSGAPAQTQRSSGGGGTSSLQSNVRDSVMHRLMLSTQAPGGISNGSGRVEQRSREEMQQYIGRNFPSHAFQQPQVNSEMDLWPNVSGADNFSISNSGNTYAYGPAPGAPIIYLPNLLSLPPLPPVYLRCPECGICKMSSEEMEVHIKVEHLHWSPFQCTECYAERSTDFQLREHVHSTHRKNYEHKYIYAYHDNPTAKRLLQLMMDRCLMNARRAQPPSLISNSQPSPTVTTTTTLPPSHFHSTTFPVNNMRERLITHTSDLDRRSTTSLSPPHETNAESPVLNINTLTNGRDRISVNQQLQRSGLTPTATVGATATAISKKRPTSDNTMSWNTNTDAVLSAIRVATHENADEQDGCLEGTGTEDGGIGVGGELDDEFSTSITSGMHDIKSAFDVTMDESTAEQSDEALLAATTIDGGQDATDILGNVAEIFSAGDISIPWKRRNRGGNSSIHDNGNITDSSTRNERPKATKSSLAKRRMMGICKCKQLITAGARQMHIFYHMAKDRQLFRFRCKYPACQVQHYRKDQMENHQSKVHGAINPMLIEDRTAELFKISQEVSLDLLGTTGNKPGPTAARAQMIYDQMMAAQARNPRNSRRKKRAAERALAVAAARAVATARVAVATAALNAQRMVAVQENQCNTIEQQSQQQQQQHFLPSVPSTSQEISSLEQTDDQQLHCQKCHKLLHNKIRGFHVLWHMSKDLGINRYICKFCDFGHDRKQAVVCHGRREHGTEDCCEDRVEEYSDEVKAMTEQCFGLQPTSLHDSRIQCKLSDQAVNDEGLVAESIANDNTVCVSVISDGISNSATYGVDEYDAKASSTLHDIESSQLMLDQSESSPIISRSFSSTSSYRDRMRKARNRRFGIRKPPSKLKRKEMAKLREISMRLGGAQYFKKRFNEAAHCQKCGLLTTSRLSDHAYKHLDVQLFLCPQCDIGNQSRDLVVKHIRDMHSSQEHPIDERWKYRVEIKEIIRECYPAYFIDAPIPTAADIEKLKQSLSSGRFFDVLGSTDDDQPENVDATLERDFVGETGDGDSDDERQVESLEPEQDAQSYTEGGDYGVDDSILCDADQAQERFVMENDGDQSVDSDTSGDDAMIEENGQDEVERFAGASSGQSSITGLPLLENEDVLGSGGILVKNEPDNHSDLTGEAEITHIVEEEEDEGEEEM